MTAQRQSPAETPGSAIPAERVDTSHGIAQTPSRPVVAAVVVVETVALASGVAVLTIGLVTAQTTREAVVVVAAAARGASDATAAATWDTSPWLARPLTEKPKHKRPILLLVWAIRLNFI